jgi:hypothetical protein
VFDDGRTIAHVNTPVVRVPVVRVAPVTLAR